jgi:hypothetical protein
VSAMSALAQIGDVRCHTAFFKELTGEERRESLCVCLAWVEVGATVSSARVRRSIMLAVLPTKPGQAGATCGGGLPDALFACRGRPGAPRGEQLLRQRV